MKPEKIREIIENATESELIGAWNFMCCETSRPDDEVFENDEYFLNEIFGNDVDAAIRATYYGHYNYPDNYVTFNGYGNLDSFNYLEEDTCPIDVDELVDFFIENEDDLGYYFTIDTKEDIQQDEDTDNK